MINTYIRSLTSLLGLAVILFLNMPCWAQQDQGKTVQQSIELPQEGVLHVSNYKGSITVTTWDRATVQFEARIEADEDVELVEDTEIRIRRLGDRLELETDYERAKEKKEKTLFFGLIPLGGSYSLPFVHYTIRMPRTARLAIDDYKSVVRVDDLQADAHIQTYKGEVHIVRQEGNLELETYKGKVRSRDVTGNVTLGTYKGNVEIEGLDGGLQVETYKGSVQVGFARFASDSAVETYKGDIVFRFPVETGFVLKADIADEDGALPSDFTLPDLQLGERAYEGAVNGGGPELRFKTYKGRLSLRKG